MGLGVLITSFLLNFIVYIQPLYIEQLYAHVSRLEAKRKQEESLKREMLQRPGYGNIWENKVS